MAFFFGLLYNHYMNKRTIQLITEADAYAWTISEKYIPECGEVNYLWEDAFRKKFTELIVRECVRVGGRAFLHDNSKVPTFPSNQILEHFGVE